MAKGRQSDFDPKKPKKLTIFTSESFPAWQTKYIELLKEVWDVKENKQKIDDKELNGRIGKMGEMKKAMPFVQALKKRLRDGEPAEAVLERKLAFDEKKTLVVRALSFLFCLCPTLLTCFDQNRLWCPA
jgi:leucyl-tRNA synthetase